MKRGTRRSISQVARRPNVYIRRGEKLYGISILEKKRAASRRMDRVTHTHTDTGLTHRHRAHTHNRLFSICFMSKRVELEGRNGKDHGNPFVV
jgi:hypothetical protein